MMSALASFSSRGPAALMAALVAQKMKAGVMIVPCGVVSRPARARLPASRALTSNTTPGSSVMAWRLGPPEPTRQIGRAAGMERDSQHLLLQVVPAHLKKKHIKDIN